MYNVRDFYYQTLQTERTHIQVCKHQNNKLILELFKCICLKYLFGENFHGDAIFSDKWIFFQTIGCFIIHKRNTRIYSNKNTFILIALAAKESFCQKIPLYFVYFTWYAIIVGLEEA